MLRIFRPNYYPGRLGLPARIQHALEFFNGSEQITKKVNLAPGAR